MNLHFEPITRQNRLEALRLEVGEGQENFIEPVSQCLSEAMYGYFWWEYFPYGRLWLDRLMIDAAFQGRGYGKAALAGLLKLLTGRYPNKDIYLSVFKGNDVAAGLYKEFGFRFNGEKDIHGEDVMVMRM